MFIEVKQVCAQRAASFLMGKLIGQGDLLWGYIWGCISIFTKHDIATTRLLWLLASPITVRQERFKQSRTASRFPETRLDGGFFVSGCLVLSRCSLHNTFERRLRRKQAGDVCDQRMHIGGLNVGRTYARAVEKRRDEPP